MNILDMRTVLVSYLISNAICALVIYSLWLQNRRRTPALNFWLADFLIQFFALVLLALRGMLPDFLSISLPVPLILAGTLLLYIGLERYVGRTTSQVHNYLFLAILITLHLYFTFAHPDLQARNLNYSAGLFVICFQIAWLMLRRSDAQVLPATRVVGITFAFYCLVSIVRFMADWTIPSGNELFQSGLYDTLAILTYQMLFIALTFTLFLMVNRRQMGELESEIDTRKRAEHANRESEEFARSIINCSLDMIIVTDRQRNIVEFNPAAQRVFGYTREEILGQNIDRLYADQTEGQSLNRITFQQGTAIQQVINQRKTGELFPCRISASLLQNADGQHIGYMGISRDITEFKRAEKKLRESEERYRGLFEHMIEGYAYCKMIYKNGRAEDWIYLAVNEAFEKSTGLKNATGKYVTELIPGIRESDPELFDRYARVVESGQSEKFEMFVASLQMWFSISVYSPEKEHFVAVFEVITERKRAEKEIQQVAKFPSENPNLVLRVGNDGKILYANASSAPILTMWERQAGQQVPRDWQTQIATVLETGVNTDVEMDYQGQIYGMVLAPIQHENYVNIYGSNITDRKRAEMQVAQMSRLYATLSQVNQTIVRVKDQKDLFQSICDVAVQYGGFALAWVGILDESSGDINPVAANGLDLAQWPFEISNVRQEQLQELAVLAVRTSQVVTSDDIMIDARVRVAPEQIQKLDYHSSAVVPFQFRGKPMGILALVSHEIDLFKAAQELSLLTEMGTDISFALNTMENATERERAVCQLRESEERYRELVQNANSAIIRWRRDGTVAFFNEFAQSFFGYAPQEIVGKPVSTLVPPTESTGNDLTGLVEDIVNHPEQFVNHVNENICRDGRRVWMTWTNKPVYDEQGRLIEILAVGSDITELKHTALALADSENRFAVAFRASPISTAITRLSDGRLVDVNDAWTTVAGLPRDQALGRLATEAQSWKNPQQRDEVMRSLNETRHIRDYEIQLSQTSGQIRDMLLSAELIDFGGEPCMLSMAVDITDRKRAEAAIYQRAEQLDSLHQIDIAISSSFDLRLVLDTVVRHATLNLKVDAVAVLLYNPDLYALEYAAGTGFWRKTIQHAQVHLGEGYAGRAALERRTISTPEALHDNPPCERLRTLMDDERFKAHHVAPLISKGQIKGVLEVFHRDELHPTEEWLGFFNVLATQAAIGIDNAQLFEGLQRSNLGLAQSYDTTLEGWSRALDLRDKETEGHSRRVTEVSIRLARALAMNDEQVAQIRRGALLHDIGKLGVPDMILWKNGPLTGEEWVQMKKHPQLARDLLMPIEYLRPAIDIPYCHHEKWDGSGYPRGLKGDEIPLAARIFAIVDVWDAVTSDRPYRPAWTREKAYEYIRSEANKHFDPKIVDLFFQIQNSP